jgi:hypothetical protein
MSVCEIKRNHEDSGSTANLQIVRSLLISYARTAKQLEATAAEMWTISYYGLPHKHTTFRLTRSDLDEHFGCPVVSNVETATAAYRDALQSALGLHEREQAAAA